MTYVRNYPKKSIDSFRMGPHPSEARELGPLTWGANSAPEDFLTVKQAADFLNVSIRTVWRMIAAGLPVIRIGRIVRIRRSDLLDFINSGGRLESKLSHIFQYFTNNVVKPEV